MPISQAQGMSCASGVIPLDFSSDAELQQLFVTELTERSATLLEGANAMRGGSDLSVMAGDMAREGHTIKGTGRVMGYDAMAAAGLMCEDVWRWIQRDELEPFPALGDALARLAEILPSSMGDDARIAAGMHGVIQALDGIDLPGELPEPPRPGGETAEAFPIVEFPTGDGIESNSARSEAERPVPDTVASAGPVDLAALLDVDSPAGPMVFDADEDGQLPPRPTDTEHPPSLPPQADHQADRQGAPIVEPSPRAVSVEEAVLPVRIPSELPTAKPVPYESMTYDLGGLVGALQTWASEESIPVNAGGLYRLINDIAAIRIDLAASAEAAGELSEAASRIDARLADRAESTAESIDAMLRAAAEIEQGALLLASVPLSGVTSTLPQLVRYLSKKTGVEVMLDLSGEDLLVDRQVLDHVGDAIRQLVANALAHGIETPDDRAAAGKPSAGRVAVHATAKGAQLEIVVTDDGAGIDWDTVARAAFERDLLLDPSQAERETLLGFLYLEGFSTLARPSEIAGDGTGLARLKKVAEDLYGTFTLETHAGRGTTVTLTVPTFRALQRALLVECSGQMWGIPEAAVSEVMPIGAAAISVTEQGTRFDWHGQYIPFGLFGDVIGLDDPEPGEHVVVLSTPLGAAAVAVTKVIGAREVAAKELGGLLSGTQTVTGAALLGGEEVVLLVDAGRLAEQLRTMSAQPQGPVHRVLVVDDSKGVQQVVAGSLASSGFATITAGSVSEALGRLGDYDVDALVVDFSMPRADGVALVHMVRQRFGVMPIVMLSGVASDEDIDRAKKAGVDAFFEKSEFRKGALAETLRSLIEAERLGTE